MFTQQSPRETLQGAKAQSALGPGSYRVNRSSLWHSRYRGPAPFLSLQRRRSVFEEEAQRRAGLPPVGQYDAASAPQYIRGHNPLTSQFASRTGRFAPPPQLGPGPGEYEHRSGFERPQRAQAQTWHARAPPAQLTEPSIPYQRPQRAPNALAGDARNRWVLDTAGADAVENPSCQDYDPGRARARPGPSAWAVAPERFAPPAPGVRAAVGLYQLGPRPAEGGRETCAFASRTARFAQPGDTAGPGVGPGSYQLAGGTIAGNDRRAREQAELRREMQRRLAQADEIARQIHPGGAQAQRQPADERFAPTARERELIANPAVGQYELGGRIAPPDAQLSVDAQMRIARLATFAVEKWHQEGASIPSKVVCEPPQEPPAPERPGTPRGRGMMELQPDRDIQRALCPQLGEPGAAVGQYEVARSFQRLTGPLVPNALPTSSFRAGNDRRVMDRVAEAAREHEHAAAEAERRAAELAGEARQVGGAETELNFNQARAAQGEQRVYFGSGVEREFYSEKTLLGGKDPRVPGPGAYEPRAGGGRAQTINYVARDFALAPPEALPAVLTEDIGPGAERALNVIAERRRAAAALGPGSYGGDVARNVAGLRRSFNVRGQDAAL